MHGLPVVSLLAAFWHTTLVMLAQDNNLYSYVLVVLLGLAADRVGVKIKGCFTQFRIPWPLIYFAHMQI